MADGSPSWKAPSFFCFAVFVICLPHSIKGTQHAWKIAFLLWIAKLALQKKRPFEQPLSAPLLAYVTLSGISTALSSEPYLSWDRMKIACLVLVGILFAQNLKRLSQVRILIFLLLLSGLGAAVFTAWQYTYGVGVQVTHIVPQTFLYKAGIHHDDIFTRINGQSVHTVAQLQAAVAKSSTRTPMRIDYLRGFPLEELRTEVSREQFVNSGYGTPELQLCTRQTIPCTGHLGPLHCLRGNADATGLHRVGHAAVERAVRQASFGGVVRHHLPGRHRCPGVNRNACRPGRISARRLRRPHRAGRQTLRIAATAVLLVLIACAALWIHHTRAVSWTSSTDTGTAFRVLMWEDGLRLVGQHPWFGVGMETVRVHWLEWNIRGFIRYHVQSHFHSTPLQIAVERGLPTLAAWLWFVVAYLIFLVRLIGRTGARSRFATAVVTAVLAGFVAFLTTSFVHYNLGEEQLVTFLFFNFGLAVAIDHMLEVPGAIDVD